MASPVNIFYVSSFGAQGDGQSDDAPAIQNALNDAQNQGGGLVVLMAGKTHLIRTPVAVGSNVTLEIPEGCVLKLGPGVNDDVVKNSNPTAGNTFVGISGKGTIDGNAANQTAGTGRVVNFKNVNDGFIRGVTVQNGLNAGVVIDGTLASSNFRNRIEGVTAFNNNQQGFWLRSAQRALVVDCIAYNNSQGSSGTYDGFLLGQTSAQSTDNLLVNCSAYDNQGSPTQRYGLSESGAGTNRNVATGCNFRGNATGEVSLLGGLSIAYTETGVFGPLTAGAQLNGQHLAIQSLTESTTIAAAATTSSTIQIPAGAVVLAVPVRVLTIGSTTPPASYQVGDGTTANKFNAGTNISSAANTTDPGTKAGPTYYAAATSIVYTPNATPGDALGSIRTTIIYYLVTPPTS